MSTTQSFLPGQLGNLVDLTSKLLEIENEDQLLQTIVDLLVHTFGYDVAYFRMVAPDSYLEIRAHAGTQSDFLHNPKERRMAPGEGINGRAISTGKVIAVSDVSNDPSYRFPEVKERENLKGMLAAPMYFSGKTAGVLSCYTRIAHEFTDEEKQFASALASMTSVILSNIRYFEEVDILSRFSQALAQKSELNDILDTIVDYAQQIARSDGVRLFPYDFEKKLFDFRLQVGRGIGQSNELARRQRPGKRGITMQILEQGLIRLEGEDISRSQLLGEETKHVLIDEGIQAFAGLALRTKQPVGVLYINYKNSTDLPSEEEIRTTFDKFLRNAAIAIERAWLFEYLQQERKLLEFASNVTSEVREVKDVWREFLDYAMRLTGATAGNISVVSKDGQYLERSVHRGFSSLVEYRHRIGGRSIQGQSVALKQSILIRKVQTDNEWRDSYYAGLPSTVSELVVPVYDSGSEKQRVIGVINLEDYEESAFDEHHLRLIELLAVHATISLKIAENYRQIDLEGSRLRSLQKAARAIITRSKHQNILEKILQEAVELTGAPFATIQKLVGDHLQFKEIYPVSQWDPLHKLIPNGIMRLDGRGLTVRAAYERRPILENDVNSTLDYWDGSNGHTRSELAVPMMIDHNQLWGVLNVEKEIKDGFTEEDQETLTALANLALAAVQSDEYYTDIQRAKNVEAISHVLLLIIHRLNNQISLIPVEAAIALDEIKKSSLSADQSKVVKKHLRKIIKNGREITNQILEIYRPFTSPLEAVNLSTVCSELEKKVDLHSNVNLSIYLDPKVPEVLASREMLYMILENMLQNSISQLQQGGRIWIKSEPVDADWAHVHIYDNGVGIPPDKLKKLSRFSFDFDTKLLNEPGSHKGLGLGLSLAYWFIKRLGGDLQIESRVTEIDHGTRITLKLPRSVERQWNRLGPLMDSHEI
jgi:GAF domain-containing protein